MRRSLRVMLGTLGTGATIYGAVALIGTPRAEVASPPSRPVDRPSNESTPMRTQSVRDADIANWAQFVDLALQLRDTPNIEGSQFEGRWPPRPALDEPWDGPRPSSRLDPPPLRSVHWDFVRFARADADSATIARDAVRTDEKRDPDLTPAVVAIVGMGVAAVAFWPRKPRPVGPA